MSDTSKISVTLSFTPQEWDAISKSAGSENIFVFLKSAVNKLTEEDSQPPFILPASKPTAVSHPPQYYYPDEHGNPVPCSSEEWDLWCQHHDTIIDVTDGDGFHVVTSFMGVPRGDSNPPLLWEVAAYLGSTDPVVNHLPSRAAARESHDHCVSTCRNLVKRQFLSAAQVYANIGALTNANKTLLIQPPAYRDSLGRATGLPPLLAVTRVRLHHDHVVLHATDADYKTE